MLKRVLLIAAAVIVLAVLWAVLSSLLGGSEKPAEPKPRPEPTVRSWDGNGTHIFNLTFNRHGQETTLSRASFRGLERLQSSLSLDLHITGANADDIEWVKPAAFVMKSNSTQRKLPAKITISADKITATATVHITMTGVPTDLLGVSKAEEINPASDNPNEALILQMPTMPVQGLVSVAITAPTPPPGHYLADPAIEKQYQSAVKLNRAKVRGMTIYLGGVVNATDAKQLVVTIDGREIKRLPAKPTFQTAVKTTTSRRHTIRVGYVSSSGQKLFPSAGQKVVATVAPAKKQQGSGTGGKK